MARNIILLDTGSLVAALARDDRAHAWAKEQFETLAGPFLTCEAVHHGGVSFAPRRRAGILRLLESGALRLGIGPGGGGFCGSQAARALPKRSHGVTDACLVRMSKLYDSCTVLTLDYDFHIYRRHGRKAIPLLHPDSGAGA